MSPPFRIRFFKDLRMKSGSNDAEDHTAIFETQKKAEDEATILMVQVSAKYGENAGYVIIDNNDTVVFQSRT